MSRSDDEAGLGCFLVVGLVLLGLVIEYWWQILVVGTITGVSVLAVALVAKAAAAWAERAEQRRRCPVCQSWSGSVLLTELDAQGAGLCPAHLARWRRITGLERETLGGGGEPGLHQA